VLMQSVCGPTPQGCEQPKIISPKKKKKKKKSYLLTQGEKGVVKRGPKGNTIAGGARRGGRVVAGLKVWDRKRRTLRLQISCNNKWSCQEVPTQGKQAPREGKKKKKGRLGGRKKQWRQKHWEGANGKLAPVS